MDKETNFKLEWDMHSYIYSILVSRLVEIKNEHIKTLSEADDDLWDVLLRGVRRNSPDLNVRIAIGQYEY